MKIYNDIRGQIESGDLLSFNHGDWISWSGVKTEIVHMATRSTYSHVGTALWLGKRLMIVEAVKPYLRIFPLSLSGSFYWTKLPVTWTDEAEEFALSKIGAEYSEWNAIKAYFVELPDGDVSECAAYTREIMKRSGIDLGFRSTPDSVVLAAQKLGGATFYIENE